MAIAWLGKIETKDSRGGEGGKAIFSELKIADFPELCGAPLNGTLTLDCDVLVGC